MKKERKRRGKEGKGGGGTEKHTYIHTQPTNKQTFGSKCRTSPITVG